MDSTNINQLQLFQQNLENLLIQKQQLESQLTELDSALTSLKKTNVSYKIIGKIMVSTPKEELEKDLEQKKEVIEVRLNHFSKQEEKLKENIDEVQQEVLKDLKEKEK